MKTIGDLITLIHKLNKDDFHIFFNFSGHVNKIDISIDYGGWKQDQKDGYKISLRSIETDNMSIHRVYNQISHCHRMFRKRQLVTVEFKNNQPKYIKLEQEE
jgi:hypothetical protein